MRDMDELRIDAQVEIGCLFGMVHASVVGDTVGAHVEIDGNVISDTGLVVHSATDSIELRGALFQIALVALRDAFFQVGLEVDRDEVLRQRVVLARALPLDSVLP